MNRSYEDKALDGFPDKRRQATPDIQTPDVELPEPPDHLNEVATKLWYQLGATLVGMRMMRPAD